MQTCMAACGTTRLGPMAAAAKAGGRPRAAVPVTAEKGFSSGTGGAGQKPKQVKKSKRGKVASRPSPKLTPEQQAELARFDPWGRQQQAGPAGPAGTAGAQPPPAAAAVDDEEIYLAPRSSSTSSSTSGRDVEYGSTAAVPEVVTDRMLKRVILFMGVPVFIGISLFPFFYWLKVSQEVDLPNWVAYVASSLTFGGGGLGISYGIMSASWDVRREGSLLGWTEFQANVPLLMDRFKRK